MIPSRLKHRLRAVPAFFASVALLVEWAPFVEAARPDVFNGGESRVFVAVESVTASGATSGGATSVTVNGVGGTIYGDGSFAVAGLAAAIAYSATVSGAGQTVVDTVTTALATPTNYAYDGNGYLTSDRPRQLPIAIRRHLATFRHRQSAGVVQW